MPELTLTVIHEVGLHARSASMFVQREARHTSDSEVTHGETTATAKSILSVLTLGTHKDSRMTVKAEGGDASEALKALDEIVANYYGEA